MKEYEDQQFETLYSIHGLSSAVAQEGHEQLLKWGIQKHTLPEWLMFLIEEIGELSEAMSEFIYRDGTPECMYNEAIQTATLALKIAEMVKAQEIS